MKSIRCIQLTTKAGIKPDDTGDILVFPGNKPSCMCFYQPGQGLGSGEFFLNLVNAPRSMCFGFYDNYEQTSVDDQSRRGITGLTKTWIIKISRISVATYYQSSTGVIHD